jgi:hypothetical protein
MLHLLLSLALLLPPQQPAAPAPPQQENPAVTALALKLYAQARAGKLDPALITPEMAQALDPATLAQEKPIFDQLGEPTRIVFESAEKHTKGTLYTYQVTFPTAQFHVKIFIHPDGRFAGYGLDL